jgi:pantoate--beta-alanine ligase
VVITNTVEQLNNTLQEARDKNLKIGFVPTMGALHAGHMALVERAKSMCDLVVVSVFVNPTQFNNSDDLKLYPRTPDTDAKLLEYHGCSVAFFPSVDDIYPKNIEIPEVNLGRMDQVMEGAFRPGHFKGVVQVVWRLFDIVKPQFAFFGLKDFQQVAVIQYMTRFLQLPVQIVPCETLREESGLAMSSRNVRLTEQQREDAVVIYRVLSAIKNKSSENTPAELIALGTEEMRNSGLELEYLQIVDSNTLESLENEWSPNATVCMSAYCGDVRLIDNMQLF